MFKDQLAAEMSRLSLTNTQLARKVKVSQATVTGWLNGRCEPKAALYARLVKVMPRIKRAYDPS